jgi:hypothetical protein
MTNRLRGSGIVALLLAGCAGSIGCSTHAATADSGLPDAPPASDAGGVDGGSDGGGNFNAGPGPLCAAAPAIHGNLQPEWALALGEGTPGRVLVSPAGQIVVGGSFTGTLTAGARTFPANAGSADNPFLLALDGSGQVLWERTLPTRWTLMDLGGDAAGNLYVVGSIGQFGGAADLGMGAVSGPLLVAKLDSAGNTLWSRGAQGIFSNATSTGTLSLAVSAAGDVAIAGDFSGGAAVGNFATLLDTAGNLVWSKPIAESVTQPEVVFGGRDDVLVGGGFNGTLALGSTAVMPAPLWGGFLAALDRQGNVLSTRTLGESSTVTALGAAGGRALLAGIFYAPFTLDAAAATPRGGQDLFVASLDDSQATPGAPGLVTFPASGTELEALAPDGAGGAFALGETGAFVNLGTGLLAPSAIVLARFDQNQQVTASAVLNAPYGARARSVAVDGDGAAIAFGTFDLAIDLGTGLLTGAPSQSTMFLAKYGPADPGPPDPAVPCPPLVDGALLSTPALPGPPTQLLVDSSTIFFTTGAEVMSIGMAGGAPTVLAYAQNNIVDLAADADALYWANAGTSTYVGPGGDGAVLSIPRAGGPATLLADHQSAPTALAVDATRVYWTTNGTLTTDGTLPSDGQLLAAPKTGSTTPGTPVVLASGLSLPGPVAVSGGFVVFATRVTGGTTPGAQIRRVAAAGGSSVLLATTDRGVTSLVTDGTTVFWTDGNSPTVDVSTNDGRVRSVPLAGGDATVLTPQRQGPGFLAIVGENLYWGEVGGFNNATSENTGTISSIPKAGGAVTTVVGHLPALNAFAADNAHIAWVETVDPYYGTWALLAAPR